MLVSSSSSFGGKLFVLAGTAMVLLSSLSGGVIAASVASGGPVNNAVSLEDRALFELTTPFNAFNQRCEETCLSGGESLINEPVLACPKCMEKYTPCNACCYDGASSLKMRFYACPGTLSLDIDLDIDCDGFVDIGVANDTDTNLTSVHFVDCDCFASATSLNDVEAVINASEACDLYQEIPLEYDSMDVTVDYFEVCLVASSRNSTSEDFTLDLSVPLPDIVGLQHEPAFDVIAGFDADATILGTTITYFDTTCFPKVDGDNGVFAYPLFPGYGKFAATCPDQGFIDFELGIAGINPLPEVIDHFDGVPPSTSFYYAFVDGTSVGFWPEDVEEMIDDDVFFLPNFATCACKDCEIDDWSIEPTSSPTSSPTSAPTQMPTTATPSAMPSASPSTTTPSGIPTAASNAPSAASPMPTSMKSNAPSALRSASPTETASEMPSSSPVVADSDMPTSMKSSNAPSALRSASPSITESLAPSREESESPTVSSFPSPQPSQSPTVSSFPSRQPSQSPTVSSFPSFQPSESPSMSAYPSSEPSDFPSVSAFPSFQPSDFPSVSAYPSQNPTKEGGGGGPPPPPFENFEPSSQPLSNEPSAWPTCYHGTDAPMDTPAPSSSPSMDWTPAPSSSPTILDSQMPSLDPTSISGSGDPGPNNPDYPSTTPSAEPTEPAELSEMPSSWPTCIHTYDPAAEESLEPSASSASPTEDWTTSPTTSPTPLDSASPSETHSSGPTAETAMPSSIPSDTPTLMHSSGPTAETDMPSSIPSASPIVAESDEPSSHPSSIPSNSPVVAESADPSSIPSTSPVVAESADPSSIPSDSPVVAESDEPTMQVVSPPSCPTASPIDPSSAPSVFDSASPSQGPTVVASERPSIAAVSDAPSQTAISESPSAHASDSPSFELDVSEAPSIAMIPQFPVDFGLNPGLPGPGLEPEPCSPAAEQECLVFALNYCVTSGPNESLCYYPGGRRLKEALQEELAFHWNALAELQALSS